MPTHLPKTDDLLKPNGPVCLAITATMSPVTGTDRFQPAGFPEVGHVIYDAPRVDDNGQLSREKICIVDSSASMANHLEKVCVPDSGSLDLHPDLKGLPYVVCQTDADAKIEGGEVTSNDRKKADVVSTFTEGHRIASDYFLDGQPNGSNDKTFREVLRSAFKIVEVKADKTYFIPPETWWSIYKTLFRYDPNSLVHGVLFAKEQIKISRMLTAHMEAFGASRVGSAGVKFDRLQKTTSGQPIFAVDEETAEQIRATFVLDLALLRSYGRDENGLSDSKKKLLLMLALWKVRQLTLRPFRYRSNCFLKCDGLSMAVDGDSIDSSDSSSNSDDASGEKDNQPEPVASWLAAFDVGAAIAACKFDKSASPTKVYYAPSELYKAGKDDDSSTADDTESREE